MFRRLSGLASAGVLGAAMLFSLAFPSTALGHEHRKIGAYEMVVGWADEPTFVGFKNGVQLILNDAQGQPVTDLGDGLKVEVIFGNQKTGPLAMEPAFGKTYGRKGDYRAPIVPTRPGNYTFHFIGTIKGQQVDQSFTSSESTFDPVAEAASIEFPVKDPSRSELTVRLERLGPRIDAAATASQAAESAIGTVRALAIVALVFGAVGIGMGLNASRRRGAA